MAKSMTSYGRAQACFATKRITAEVKSVNNRYFDCTVKVPSAYGFLEKRAEQYLRQNGISRGKVNLYIGIERTDDPLTQIHLDRAYAKSYLDALYQLRDTFSLTDDISTMSVAQNRELFTVLQEDEDSDALWEDVQSVLKDALDAFLQMRDAEGAALCRDLAQKKAHLCEMVAVIAARAPQINEDYRRRLEEKLNQTLEQYGQTVDSARILTECAIFADRVAIDEELVRLQSHFDAFDRILEDTEPIGRKLDFLLQEMNRETNTIGSKCNDSQIAELVIEMKCELEKIREQIQNLE
jgi:uncharacterized protein (TIGR00255 family)